MYIFQNIWDVLRDLVLSVQFKKRENTHGGVLLLVKVKVTLLYGLFSRFLTCQYNLYFLITIMIERLDKLRKYYHEFQLL